MTPILSQAFRTWQRACARAGWRPQLGSERVGVAEAVGRVTAAPVHARWSSPAHEAAAMDGIAVLATDVVGASEMSPVLLTPDRFDPVDTGDPLPPGRDAVVMREHVQHQDDGGVQLVAPVTAGRHIRRAGEDIMAGEPLLPTGHRLRPVDVAVVAAAGHIDLMVQQRPVVAILPTGDEVRPIGSAIGRGEVLDTNSLMLAEQAREAGCATVALPVERDDPGRIAAAVRGIADRADLVLVIAGSSAGRGDHTPAVLAELGQVAVQGVAMRPGHPVVLGLIHAARPVPAIGVPGYPVSAAHVFEMFAVPLIGLLLGTPAGARPTVRARLARAVSSPPAIDEWVRVGLTRVDGPLDDGGGFAALPVSKGAGVLSSLMRAGGLLRIPAGSSGHEVGAEVVVELLPGAPPPGDSARWLA
ncbi:MAG: molybdopterin-binding protein [Pseudonocardiaceae bacterium]